MKATLLTKKRISEKESRAEGIVNYDDDNAYPQRVKDIIQGSNIASLCKNLSLRFLVGQGFQNTVFFKQKINRLGLTPDKLFRKVGSDLLDFNGFAIHVNYNANYEKISYNYIPFSWCRITTDESKEPNKVAVYDDWQRIDKARIDKEAIDYIDYFDDSPAAIDKQVEAAKGWENYKGQIYWFSTNGKSYPLSPVDAALEDMQTDAKIKLFKFRNVSNNFMASHLLEVNAFEEPEDKAAFEQTLSEFQGADDALKILLLEKQAGEETTFNLQKVDIQAVDSLYQYTEESVRNAIIRAYSIPLPLLLEASGSIGTSKEIEIATIYFNSIMSYYHTIIQEVFAELFRNSAFIDESGYNILPIKQEIDKTELTNMLSNSQLDSEQKMYLLEMIYGYSKEDALKLAGI